MVYVCDRCVVCVADERGSVCVTNNLGGSVAAAADCECGVVGPMGLIVADCMAEGVPSVQLY